jgi:hypothetical protein
MVRRRGEGCAGGVSVRSGRAWAGRGVAVFVAGCAWFTPGSTAFPRRRAHGWCVVGPCGAGGLAPAAALFHDGSLDVSSVSLSGGLSVQGEAMHYGGLTLMPPPAGAASTLAAPAGVVSASTVGPAGRKVSLFRVGPRFGLSTDDGSGSGGGGGGE